MPVGNKFAAIAPVFTFTAAGSTTVLDLAPFTKDFSLPQSMKSSDSTGYTNTNMQYVKTISDLNAQWTTFLETGNVIEDALIPGAAGTIIFGPNGSTVGMRKYTLTGFVENFEPAYPFSEVSTAPTTFKPTSNLTRGVYP